MFDDDDDDDAAAVLDDDDDDDDDDVVWSSVHIAGMIELAVIEEEILAVLIEVAVVEEGKGKGYPHNRSAPSVIT